MKRKIKTPKVDSTVCDKVLIQETTTVVPVKSKNVTFTQLKSDTESNSMDSDRTIGPCLRSSKVWLHRLYEMWVPQHSGSYRPSAVRPEVMSEEDKKNAKRKNIKDVASSVDKLGKFRVAETVVVAVHHLQSKLRDKNRLASNTNINSANDGIGQATNNSVSNSKRRNSIKRLSVVSVS